MKKSLFTFVIFTLFSFIISAQNTDLKLNENISKETIKFQFIKNLIIIPIKLNGHDMNFIVDSGLRETILFSQFDNTIDHNSLKKIKLKGLGKDENGTTGYLSSGNKLMIGKNLISEQSTVIIIQDEYFNLFSRLGIEVHGIIGYDIFKNYALEIDYPNQKITFYLDTEILFNMAGYNGELYQNIFNEFYSLIKEINIKTKNKTSKFYSSLRTSYIVPRT